MQPYDFESPELISGDDRDRLDAALEAWGRQLGMQITAKTRAVVDVATAPSRVQSFGAFIASAEGPTLWATAQFGTGPGALPRPARGGELLGRAHARRLRRQGRAAPPRSPASSAASPAPPPPSTSPS